MIENINNIYIYGLLFSWFFVFGLYSLTSLCCSLYVLIPFAIDVVLDVCVNAVVDDDVDDDV